MIRIVLLIITLVVSSVVITFSETERHLGLNITAHQSDWIAFSPPDKSFTVKLPSVPRRDTGSSKQPDPDGALDAYTVIEFSAGFHIYSIGVFDASHFKDASHPDGVMDALIGLMSYAPKKLVSKTKISVDGMPGREFFFTNKLSNNYGRGRVIHAGTRIYVLVYLTEEEGDASSHSATRFLDSFRIRSTSRVPTIEF